MENKNEKAIIDILIDNGIEVDRGEPVSFYQNEYRTFKTALELFNWLTEDGISIRELVGVSVDTRGLPFEEWYILQDNIYKLPDGSYLYVWL